MEEVLTALKAAAEPTRLRILALCQEGELTVTDLTRILGQSQPRVSRHLKLLGDAGLLDRYREGTSAYFRRAESGPGAELARRLAALLPEEDPQIRLDRSRLAAIREDRAAHAAAYFRANAAEWERIRRLHIDDSRVEAALLSMLPEGPIKTLVDLGSGAGRMLVITAPRIERGVGVDLSREMLAVGRAALEREGLHHCQMRLGDLQQLPLPTSSADVAIMHHALHYVESPAAALAEAARILKPDGVLLLADFARHDVVSLREEHAHRWLGFEEGEIARWLKAAGFDAPEPLSLPGETLTILVWRGVRRATPVAALPTSRRSGQTARSDEGTETTGRRIG